MNMKYLFSFLLICLVGLSFSFGQKVTYYGEIIDYDSERKVNGVTVRVLHNGSEVASVSTAGGKYTLQFDPGKNYVIEYVKAGYVTKVIHVDVTGFHEEDLPPGGKIFPPINIDLFTERTGADFSFLKTEPVVKWYFDRDKMSYDARQASAMKKKITDKLAEAEAANKNAEAQYNALIQEADKLFNDKSYEDALGKYGEALQIPGKETEPYPSNRIIEIGNILQKQAEEELSFKQENQAYLNLIEAADNLAEQKEYDKALLKYEEAIELNSEEQYPYDRIDQIKEIVALERRREEYNQLITRADMFFNQNSIEAARDKYEEALRLFNDEQYPKDQLAKINKELDEQSEIRQRRENYNRAVEAGDKHFDNEEYEQAIEKYREAITYESASPYPSDRIAMAKSRLEEIQAEKEKKENFDRLVQEGNEKVEEKAYETAISKYNEALGLIDDAEVKALRENAQQLLDAQMANAEQQAAFDVLVAEGNAQVDAKNYETAISKYNEALGLIDDAEVKALRENAQQLLDAQLANAEQQATFDALVAEGNAQVDAKNYETAIAKYNEALGLIDDAEVKALRENAQQLLDAQLANAEQQTTFNALVAEGNTQVDAKNYETAISKYNEALDLIDDAEVKALRDNTQQLLDAQLANAEQQTTFNALVAEGNTQVAEKNYVGAISDYSSVLSLNVQHAEAIEGKGNAERLLAEEQGNEQRENQFNELVAQADEAFQNENWEDAKTKYIAAKAVISDNQHVNDRITEIQSLQDNLAATERRNEEIQVLLTQAENLKMNNSWGQAIQKYEEALSLDGERSDIEELLNQAKVSQAAWDATQSKDELFDQLKREGETFMATEKWTDAKAKFEAALEINEDAEITAHLTLIEQKIQEAAEQQLIEANYQAKMQAGENFASAEEFQKAFDAFQEALGIKENDPMARSRMLDMQQQMEGLGRQEEKEARYNAAMTSGKEAMNTSDYAAAIKFFDDALLEKPMDNEANRLLTEAKNKIQALQSEEVRYEAFVSEGNALLNLAKTNDNDIPTLEEAKAKFREAQLMRLEASLPQNRIVEIDNLLRQIEEEQAASENQEVERKYQEKIELATIAAQGENFQNAIDHLKEASNLKPNEQYPKDKIVEYQNILDRLANQNAAEEQYRDLVGRADLAFDNKQYENSIALYNQALGIKENEAYPKSQIAKAEQAIEDANEGAEERQYLSFISQGDQNFANKSFEEALGYYESALGVKANDSYATDKISEIRQILNNLREKEAENLAKKALYEQYIAEADALFDNTDYIGAKELYDKAVDVMPNDVYAIERSQLSVVKSKEKTDAEDNALYQKIIAKADEFFDVQNFDQARELYERRSEEHTSE